jgi:D-alanyl-D-alanine carboxypeptidase (penicillin-binding protein 5/6)
MKQFIVSLLLFVLIDQMAWAGRAPVQTIARDPYLSALVLNADSGETLFADNPDARVYPASVLKLMVLLITLERIEQGALNLDDMVQVTVEAYKMGGSQVYLDPKEQFPVEDLLYALMVQSANDAAVALATHVAGSKENFVALMNQKAAALGMKDTHFYSVHGLPPAKGQKVDVTTARDFGIFCLELAKHPEIFKYTSTRVKGFRNGQFIMRNHNHLLGKVDGCDGFKTGYFTAAGFSIAATAKKNGVRIIALVMGSRDRKVRDVKAAELLAKGFAMVPPLPPEPATDPAPPRSAPTTATTALLPDAGNGGPILQDEKAVPPASDSGWRKFFAGLGVGATLVAALTLLMARRRNRRNKYR